MSTSSIIAILAIIATGLFVILGIRDLISFKKRYKK